MESQFKGHRISCLQLKYMARLRCAAVKFNLIILATATSKMAVSDPGAAD